MTLGSGESTTADRCGPGHDYGTAESGSDYVLTAAVPVFANASVFEVTIPAGQTSVTVTLTPASSRCGSPETATFTAEGTSATVTIADELP